MQGGRALPLPYKYSSIPINYFKITYILNYIIEENIRSYCDNISYTLNVE